MGQQSDTLRFLPGRVLVRLVWAIRRRLAKRPAARRRLQGEIRRELRRLTALDARLDLLPVPTGHGTEDPSQAIGQAMLWSLTPVVFRRALFGPSGADPVSGSAIGPDLTLFHDGAPAVMSWRQSPDPAVGWGAQRLGLVVYQFTGSFLSLVVAVPSELAARARGGMVVEFAMTAAASRPIPVFLRLNVTSGGQQATLHETLMVLEGGRRAVFDLAPAADALVGQPRLWLDLIFADPAMVALEIGQLTLALRRPEGPR